MMKNSRGTSGLCNFRTTSRFNPSLTRLIRPDTATGVFARPATQNITTTSHSLFKRFSALVQATSASRHSIPAEYWRGGTSRAVIFQRKDLPKDETKWPSIFLRVLGSPDKYCRQLDGLGTGCASLSKVCIVSPSTHPSADIDYTFAACSINSSDVDLSANCGNMCSAIGPFAYNHGLVQRANGPSVTIRIHNTNTGKLIHSTFPVTDDGREAATNGRCTIDGVSGCGPEIRLSFLDPAGSKTGTLLPTGNVADSLDGIKASCIDAASPCVFVQAADIGFDDPKLPDEMAEEVTLMQRLEELRCHGAQAMGVCNDWKLAPKALPKTAIVSKPANHKVLNDEMLAAEDLDLVARVVSHRQPHRAIPITIALCLAAAATVKGSVVESLLRPKRVKEGVLTIGHPSGTIQVKAEKTGDGKTMAAEVSRTARLLMAGRVYR